MAKIFKEDRCIPCNMCGRIINTKLDSQIGNRCLECWKRLSKEKEEPKALPLI